ncbi:hypothetical protein niasHT_011204 [Heterodera trifolii]|uniref:Uncharacterized protein n=1 Tax=Heterodera trifolii TaxID=157864 RepID=A0ABD2LDH2_9BILA
MLTSSFSFGNMPIGARGNGPNADKNSAIVRKKRVPISLKEAFVNSFWRALDPKTGQFRSNAAADPGGLELGENAVFAMEPSHCYDDCLCKWGNCIKMADGPTILKEADECCAANHQFKCCEFPDLFPDNMTAITESLQSKCIDTVPILPDGCGGGCGDSFAVAVYANGKKEVKERTACFLNNMRIEGLLSDYKNYFFLEHANCSRCGWALCASFYRTDFACKCCDYATLVATNWKIGECKYERVNEDPKCAVCKWKLSDFYKVETCCSMEGLKKCFKHRTPETEEINPMRTKQCVRLIKKRCECGYGICKPRQGRAASTCCEEHNDLACCIEGTKPFDWDDWNGATVAPFKVPLLVLVLFVSKLVMAHTLG